MHVVVDLSVSALYLCACAARPGFCYFPYKMENFLYVAFVSFSTHAKWLFHPNP